MRFTILLSTLLLADMISCLQYATFQGPPVSLKSGQIANTDPFSNKIPWVEGPIAIHSYAADIVDDTGASVPLSEVYVHHWLVLSSTNERLLNAHNGGYCAALSNVFGIGAEFRGSIYEWEAPYAIITTGEEVWSTNLHLIRTTNVPQNVLQLCIECHCGDAQLPTHPHGSVACCVDRDQCWGMKNSTLEDAKNYYLRYTIGYDPVTPEKIDVQTFSLDVTATNTTNCRVDYQLPSLLPGEEGVLSNLLTISSNLSAVYLEPHLHIGGKSLTVEHYRNGENLGVMCSAEAVYGSGGLKTPGNETDYVVGIPPCTWPAAAPYKILEGDQLKLTSVYTGRHMKGGYTWHEGIMGIVYLYAHASKSSAELCQENIQLHCPQNPCQCIAQSLQYCTAQAIQDTCAEYKQRHSLPMGGILPPANLRGQMTLTVRGNTVIVTGPKTGWFAVGFNSKPMMNGATAFVYNGSPAKLTKRQLGMHAPGTVLEADYPATVIQQTNGVHISFVVPGMHLKPAASACWLFAHSDQGSMAFAYHGAQRGVTCPTTSPPQQTIVTTREAQLTKIANMHPKDMQQFHIEMLQEQVKGNLQATSGSGSWSWLGTFLFVGFVAPPTVVMGLLFKNSPYWRSLLTRRPYHTIE